MQTDILKATQTPNVSAFLNQPHIARLASCEPDSAQPHVVPVWYEWDGEIIWVSTFRSTRKVRELRRNPRFSLVIDTDGRGELARGVLFEGHAEFIELPEECKQRGFKIYARYLGEDGANELEPQSWLDDPEHLLLRLVPEKVHVFGLD